MNRGPAQRQLQGAPAMNPHAPRKLPDRRVGAGFPGGIGAGAGYNTSANVEPWAVTEWTEYYIPTVAGNKRPVIYVAAPLNQCAMGGMGGMGGMSGMGGMGGMGGLGGMGGMGSLGGMGGGFPMRR